MADTTKKASVQIVNEEQENMAVTEVETTEEENKTLIRMNEDDFIQGLISAADYAKDDTQRIEIARNGKVLFAFEIRPLSEEEYNKRYSVSLMRNAMEICTPPWIMLRK